MKKMMFILCAVLTLLGTSASSKTLVVYYSYTGNCHEIVTTLTSQIQADVLEIQPADKGLKYEAVNKPVMSEEPVWVAASKNK